MKLSFKWVIVTGFLGLIWGTQIIITSSSYITSERVLLKHAKNIMANITELTMEQSQNHLGLAQGAAHLTKRLIASNVVSNDQQSLAALEKYFMDQLVIYPHFAGIYYGTTEGEFFYVSRSDTKVKNGLKTKLILKKNGVKTTDIIWRDETLRELSREMDPNDTYDPRKRPWFIKAVKEDNIVWTDPYIFFTSKKPGITIAGPVKSEQNSIKGIVGVDIDIEQLSVFISKLEIGQNGKAFMFNNNGDVVAFHDISRIILKKTESRSELVNISKINDPVIRKAFRSIKWASTESGRILLNEPCFGTFFHNRKKFNIMFSPFSSKQWPWIIGVYLPEDDYLGSLKKNRKTNFILTIIISIIATIIALLLSRSILKPISNLEKEAIAIGNLDMLTQFDTRSGYSEIQCMADAFNTMKNRLNKDANEKLELENQLIRSERLAATGQLASSIANEINSPLQALLLLITAMEDKYRNDISLSRDIETIKQIFDTIKNRMGSFQDLNRPDMEERSLYNFNDIIESTVNLMRASLSKSRIKVNMDFDPNLPEIRVAFIHFAQIFLNIINNSVEAISKNAEINASSIKTDVRLPIAGTIHIRTSFNQGHATISIGDTGPGFDEEILPVIFDLFSTERKTIDIGIGLSICQGLVREYSGSITAANISGGGAEVVIIIPVVQKIL